MPMRISVTQATTVTNMSAFGLSKRIRPIADDDHRCVARPTGCAGREIRSGVKAIEPSYSACRAAIRRTIFRLLQPVFTQFDFVRPGMRLGLGSISRDVYKIVAEYQKQLSPGNRIEVIGQIDSMNAAFRDLAIGILFAAVFVYLLMVVNYQNWGDPFVVILAFAAVLGAALYWIAMESVVTTVTKHRERMLAELSQGDGPIASN